MLVISRKLDEALVIGENVEITVIEISKDKIKLGINAPKDVRVKRREILATEEENKQASKQLSIAFIEKIFENNMKGSVDDGNR